VDWAKKDAELEEFCRRLIRLRRRHPIFRRRRWFEGVQVHSSDLSDNWQLVLDTEVGFVPKGQRCTSGVGMDIAPHTLRLHRRRQVGLPSEE
jgi:pullulanase/glycogen debranching enzyme